MVCRDCVQLAQDRVIWYVQVAPRPVVSDDLKINEVEERSK